ncbi:MAG TPA: hypothetical protein VI386_22160 [Candidatus Sulfotelmatobacter sp.]
MKRARLTVMSLAIFLHLAGPLALAGREKNVAQYGAGFTVNVPMPEQEVVQAVEDVVQNGIIRGTKEYSKDEYVTGAAAVTSTRSFPEWTEGGKVFYKQKLHVIDPINFKNTNDVGTLTVRYVVQAQDEKATVLRIDAVFVEDTRHATHPSNGTVESTEYKDIHDHLEAMESVKSQTIESEKAKQERSNPALEPAARQWSSSSQAGNRPEPTDRSSAYTQAESAAEQSDSQTSQAVVEPSKSSDAEPLEKRVHDLRQQVERVVKAPGAPLKSAPFNTASTFVLLPEKTKVLIVISTRYWFGVETPDGQHGWIPRDQLDSVP